MRFDNSPADDKAETGAFFSPRSTDAGPSERFEKAFLLVIRNADTMIAYLHPHFTVPATDRYGNNCALGRKFNGVGDYVIHNLLQFLAVAPDTVQLTTVMLLQDNPLFLRQQAVQSDHLISKGPRISASRYA